MIREKILDSGMGIMTITGLVLQEIKPYLSFVLMILSIAYYLKKLLEKKENGLDR
jgi:hypothetical protein